MTNAPAFDRPIAHRGYHTRDNGIIENSASAFAAAIDLGYAIECDLQLSGDDKPMVFHDDKLERLTGHKGKVRQLSAGQLGRIPLAGSIANDCAQRFEEMLEQVGGRTLLVVELKHQSDRETNQILASRAVEILKTYEGRVVLESFSPHLLQFARAAGFTGELGIVMTRNYSNEEGSLAALDAFLLRHLLHWPQSRFSFISCHNIALDLPMVRLWRSRGMPVTSWTIRSQDEADAALRHSDQIVFEGYEAPIAR